MTNLAAQPAGRSPAMRVRQYKDFLTPALHRSFTNAALVGLGVCWLDATLMSRPGLFWSWFPLGITGIRTSLLFISCLTIFVLRVAYMHVGPRTRPSDPGSILQALISKRALWTVVWYWLSAFLFSETYIFSTNSSSNLAWVDSARSYERPRLNERAVLYRSLFGILAVVQAVLHVVRDYDALDLSGSYGRGTASSPDDQSPPATTTSLPPMLQDVRRHLPAIAIRSVALAIEVAVFGPLVYFLLLRGTAWSISLGIAKIFYTVQKSQSPTGLADVFALFARYFVSSLMLVSLWEATNTAFTICASKAPLKKGQPLTSDSAKPNESLITGLKSKKEIPRAMALWELQLIAENFEARRKTIFNDFEKPGASTWLDVLECCLAEIQSVSSSVKAALAPPGRKQAPMSEPQPPPKPRLSRPLQDNPQIYSPSKRPSTTFEALAESAGALAKSLGQSRSPDPLTSKARAFLEAPPGQPDVRSRIGQVTNTIQTHATDLLRTPAGYPFRRLFSERLNAAVFGAPHSNAADLHHAVRALSQLAVHSLREDNFGQVQRDVPRIIRALSTAISDVQLLVRTLQPDWTDVWFDDAERKVPEVEELLVTLKGGLESIVLHFGEYAGALGIGREELRRAKDLAGKGDEMQVVKR